MATSIASILRDGEDPSMPALRNWLEALSASVSASSLGLRVFKSKVALDAYVPTGNDPVYAFVADGAAFRGYRFDAGAWSPDGTFAQGLSAVIQPLVAAAALSADRAEAALRKANPEGFVYGDVRFALAVDADGYATAWFDADGALHAKLADGAVQGETIKVFTADVSAGFVDMDGYVAGALNAGGNPVTVSGPFVARVAGADGARDIMLTDPTGSAYLTYSEGDSTTPTVQGDQIAWLRGTAMKSRDISARAVVSAGVTTIAMIAGYGQSNSVGGDPGPIGLDRVPLDPGRGIMFPGGIVPARYGELVTEADLGQMVDLSGPARDSLPAIGPRLVRGYIGALPVTQAVAYASSGVRGLRYDQLKPGTPFWANLIRTIVVAKLQAWRAGLGFTVDAMPYVQGESNFATATTDSYKANLFEMRDAFRIAVRAITFSATAAPPILIVQPSSWTAAAYKLTTAQVPLAQMAAMAEDAASFAVVGPMYSLTHMADGLHPDAEGQRRMDEMIGDGLARMVRGAGAAGLYVTQAVRNGATVTATCRLPEGGALAIDTALVSNPGQFGVRYIKADGSEVAISNIVVNGATITLTLATAVAGTLRFALDGTAGQPAGPTTGARCCIRDTFAAPSANGQPRYNWMLHHAIGVA
ncbi:hypothetical protein SPHINGO391_470043 [Sphingomonas aurantiaca]|uniref:Sialate O-acetylesterase domain-containing protein n=2 Tax=Sphingomonas aurantiaca TaxID=185949 RepID=A0A5E7ZM83_9SPHN|nr:hypothetical protein SPHINGO391_470043 [Sphingomonas aurantiaca]